MLFSLGKVTFVKHVKYALGKVLKYAEKNRFVGIQQSQLKEPEHQLLVLSLHSTNNTVYTDVYSKVCPACVTSRWSISTLSATQSASEYGETLITVLDKLCDLTNILGSW